MRRFGELRASATKAWTATRQRYFWIDHLLIAWQCFGKNNGSQYAAAITYFSFLALFPLLLLAVSVTGFILHSNQELQDKLFDKITEQVPGSFGSTLSDSIHSAINARTEVGIVALVGLLLTGLGWIGNLRLAVDAVWGVPRVKRNMIKGYLANFVVLVGLGLAALISIGLTVAGTSLTGEVLRALDLSQGGVGQYLTRGLGIVIPLAGDMLVFGWLLLWLPRARPPRALALRGLLLASVGFEILKIVGTYTIASFAKSPTAGPFASVLAVLIWVQLVARWMLFCAAWLATGASPPAEPAALPTAAAVVEPVEATEPVGPSPAGVAASIFGAGAVLGAGGATLLRRRRDRSARSSGRPSS